MTTTIEELQQQFAEYEKMEGDPKAEDFALKHVEIVVDLFSEWSDDQLGFLMTDLVQMLRVGRKRMDIVTRIFAMIAEHDRSILLHQAIQGYLHHRN